MDLQSIKYMKSNPYMELALRLARKGEGRVNPNPCVGAVIVKDGEIIGSGYHEAYGGFHAERNAIRSCRQSPEGSELYVTLEPCCHHGKTPPCTDAIIESRIRKVYIGTLDPNPLVAGNGVMILKRHGIEVVCGVMEEECRKCNEIFFHFIQNKTPFVTMKYAMTADGKIATTMGKSRWITGKAARMRVQEERNRHQAIMVGVNTVFMDNPRLTCHMANGRNPIRIICDTNLNTPISSHVVATANEATTLILTACKEISKRRPYLERGCEVIMVPQKGSYIDLKEAMRILGEKKIDSILLEGGAGLNFSALNEGIVNKVQCYVAPKIFGGIDAKTPVGGLGISEVNDCFRLTNSVITRYDEDILIESDVQRGVFHVYGNN